MNTKKWPLFKEWEEIFGKDRAIGEFAEGPLDATEEIQKSQAPQHSNDMSLGFLIDVDLDDDEEEEEEENSYHSSKIGTEEAENVTGPSVFNEGENVAGSENEHAGS
ncbi:hypothetical protein KY290_031464 [Solanum tuberosum]|uniref:Uncharacterized protein n=1 Tax=Solanum tuberosum TaxID=4113 RepID=A0ABQ7U987_SOLTU|nr:hypothetical protein KY290_031464 [Solanum tuberosum]